MLWLIAAALSLFLGGQAMIYAGPVQAVSAVVVIFAATAFIEAVER